MTNSTDPFFFYFNTVFALLFLYSAWANLARKRITKIGVDAFIFALYSVFAKEKVEKLNLRENPQFVRQMGILTIILGFSFTNAAIVELKNIWPYL